MVTSDVLITNRTSLKNMPYFDFHAFIHHLSHNQETISLLIPATCIINEIISSLITAFELIKDFINMQKWSTWSRKKMSISYSLFQNQYNKWSIQQLFFIPFFFCYSWLFFCYFIFLIFLHVFQDGWLASYPQINT
jgi:hypothetical protein